MVQRSGVVRARGDPHQGAKDGRAITGQNLSGRHDPKEPSWGADDFSSETQGRGADALHGVTNHGPYDGKNTDGRCSYFDNGTAAQCNTAKAAMGLGETIPDQGNPFDRMQRQTKGNWLMRDRERGMAGDGPSRRTALVLTGALAAALLVTSCAGPHPANSSTKDSAMTPERAHQEVLDVFGTIKSVVGTNGWDTDFDSSWAACPSVAGASQFSLYAARRRPLGDSPDAVTAKVAAALEAAGYKDVRVQHDGALKPPRTVIGYPNGYNSGTAEDGFGIQFQSGTDYAATIIYGHCVPGKPPRLGTPLNPRPSDSP